MGRGYGCPANMLVDIATATDTLGHFSYTALFNRFLKCIFCAVGTEVAMFECGLLYVQHVYKIACFNRQQMKHHFRVILTLAAIPNLYAGDIHYLSLCICTSKHSKIFPLQNSMG